jgi:fructose-1,6-bisphosphatase
MPQRVTVADTDECKELARQVEELQDLIQAYRTGVLEEKI